jgi:transposase
MQNGSVNCCNKVSVENALARTIGRGLRKKVALLNEYVANCRKDWHRKLSHQICTDTGMVFVEALNLIGLSRGILGKHCLDAGFGQLFNILEQTCFKRGLYSKFQVYKLQ